MLVRCRLPVHSNVAYSYCTLEYAISMKTWREYYKIR